jgi:hypothetical protein
MSFGLGFWAAASTGAPQTYEQIATATGTGSNPSISFSSIPTIYKHLQIRVVGRNTNANQFAGITYRFNGDTASNYAYHLLYGTGSSVVSQAGANSNVILDPFGTIGGSSASGIFAAAIMDILDYGSTSKNKTVRVLSGCHNSGTENRINLSSGAWFSTAAINSITVEGSLNFAVGTRFTLYGVRG